MKNLLITLAALMLVLGCKKKEPSIIYLDAYTKEHFYLSLAHTGFIEILSAVE